ncbi:MAG: hypothetical protein R2712_02460 [Vicinamibacterales bacterium]
MHTRFLTAVFLLLATLAASRPAAAQNFILQQQFPGTTPGSQLGTAVDVEGDVAVIGAPRAMGAPGSSQGVVYVLRRTGATWAPWQQLTVSDGTGDFEDFGTAVALNGTTIVVGAPRISLPGGSRQGAAYVFVFDGTAWVPQARLTATDPNTFANFGAQVSLSGNVAVVGAPQSDRSGAGDAGAAYVFERVGTTWSAQSLPVTGLQVGDQFGSSVSVLGQTACVGAPQFGLGGAVYVYTRGTSSWALQQTLTAPDAQAADFLGYTCAVGTDLVVGGAPGAAGAVNLQGAAYAFSRSGTTWTFEQKLVPSQPETNSFFGRAGFSLDGDQLAVGASGSVANSPYAGSVYVFDRVGTTWAQRQRILAPVGSFPGLRFGASVAIDANTLLAGAPCSAILSCAGGAAAYASGITVPEAPGAPATFTASVSGNTVSMAWDRPASGGAPTGYTILARGTAGGSIIASLPVGTATTHSVVAPNGQYVVSVVASNAVGTGPESAAVTVVVPQAVAAPGPPSSLAASVSGSTVTFTWTPPASGGAATGYTLVAGLTPNFTTVIATLPIGAVTSTVVTAVPPGTYYARVVARNGGGTSAPSNEVSVVVSGPNLPAAPTILTPQVAGHTVSLNWMPAPTGGVPTSYLLYARTAPGGPVILSSPIGGTALVVENVPSGTYYVTVAGVNDAGTGPVSTPAVVVVP